MQAIAEQIAEMIAIEPIEITQEVVHAPMQGLFEEMPIETAIVIPFAFLRELAAHE